MVRQRIGVLAVPRDANPFQENLYRRLRSPQLSVDYLSDGPTGSQTVNLLLTPAALFRARLQGFNVLHVHWLFGFVPPWARSRWAARTCRLWFVLVLALSRALGFRIVWTAHNVLPHDPVFDDDVAARRALAARCAVIVAMNSAVADAVRDRFRPACPVEIIPHGVDLTALRASGPRGDDHAGRTRIVFFGRVEAYKGVPELLAAFDAAELPSQVSLLIAGECKDPGLRSEITDLASKCQRDVELMLRTLSDAEVESVLAQADVMVFPFRAISTSGSVVDGLRSGAPTVLPRLPAFADLPDDAVVRYEGGPAGLPAALSHAARLSADERSALVAAARRYLAGVDWDVIAKRYAQLFDDVLEVVS